ncbi:unnamed protein product [Lactuca saligna]|uniref:Saccharopine dehydrogenase NADP binding domain-containing protein n=1 Tax=Lactuca saligna TaxID=75948 RepID=A0AA35ZHE1_LACSI|nr:unnamed protein product [Lactuca saligna]
MVIAVLKRCHQKPLKGFTNGEWEETTTRGVLREAKLVLDCVGPFHLYGEPVVAACVEAGCDYLYISGASEFMERMEVMYHEKAVEKVDVFTVDIYTQ